MLSLISWWQKIFWKNWKYFLIFVAIVFFIVQLGNMSSLGIFFDSSSTTNTKHRQHVAIKKLFPKWKVPHHSRLIRDPQGNSISLRGTLDKDILRYFPNSNGKFTCFNTKNEIDFVKINDDYCDCPEDGSDEPGTNACNNGNFYCERTIINYPVRISSYKVNDGICDCCDGSDEWMEIFVLDTNHFSEGYHLKHNITRCQNRCKNL